MSRCDACTGRHCSWHSNRKTFQQPLSLGPTTALCTFPANALCTALLVAPPPENMKDDDLNLKENRRPQQVLDDEVEISFPH
jgi:hypothetical protein